jgi:hypothetical protein
MSNPLNESAGSGGGTPFALFETVFVPPPQVTEQQTPESVSPSASGSSFHNAVHTSVSGHRIILGNSTSSNSASLTSQNNLIINYIPVEVTEAEFRQLFEQFGALESCKIVVDRVTGYSKGYGFVRYADGHAAVEAMRQLDGFAIYNKKLKVGLASRQGGATSGGGGGVFLSSTAESPVGSRIILKDDGGLTPTNPSDGSSFNSAVCGPTQVSFYAPPSGGYQAGPNAPMHSSWGTWSPQTSLSAHPGPAPGMVPTPPAASLMAPQPGFPIQQQHPQAMFQGSTGHAPMVMMGSSPLHPPASQGNMMQSTGHAPHQQVPPMVIGGYPNSPYGAPHQQPMQQPSPMQQNMVQVHVPVQAPYQHSHQGGGGGVGYYGSNVGGYPQQGSAPMHHHPAANGQWQH